MIVMQLTQLFGALELDHLDPEGAAFHRELARKIKAQMGENPAALKTCLDRLRRLVLSDRAGFYFDVSATPTTAGVVLSGSTERREFKDITRGVFRQLGYPSVVDRIEIVPDLKSDPAPFGVVQAPHVLTWSQPDLHGTPMDEALLGEPVYVLKEFTNSLLIKTLTGYWGFAAPHGIQRLGKAEFIQLLNEPKVILLEDFQVQRHFLPSGCQLRIASWGDTDQCELRDVDGASLQVPKAILKRPEGDAQMEQLLAYARSFLDAPYQLGGKNHRTGIDCSGLVQLSYRLLGVNLPRDANQQYLGGHLILPCVAEALRPGDALFFMNAAGQVDHVGLYLGNQEMLHATMNEVKIQSLIPGTPNYLKRFDDEFIGAKRFWW